MISINQPEYVAIKVDMTFDIDSSYENLTDPDGYETQDSDIQRLDCALYKKESNSNNDDAHQRDPVNNHLQNSHDPDGYETQDSDIRRLDCTLNKKESNSDNNDAHQPDPVNNHLQKSHVSLYSILDILYGDSSSSHQTGGYRKIGIAITIFMWTIILALLGLELLQVSGGYNWASQFFIYFIMALVLWIALLQCGIAQCPFKNI